MLERDEKSFKLLKSGLIDCELKCIVAHEESELLRSVPMDTVILLDECEQILLD